MPVMPATVINPIITNAGLNAAVAASGLGLQLGITHVQIGSSAYVLNTSVGSSDYNRTALVAPTEKVAIAAGHVMDKGFRVDAQFPAWTAAAYGATEIGFWAGDPAAGGILFALWAQATPFTQRNNIDYLASFAVALTRVPNGSITTTFDPDLQKAIALVNFHEAAADPHTQYVEKAGDTMLGPLLLAANSTAPTPALYDATTKVATMAAIQRALGNRSGVRILTASTVLTSADYGKLILVDATTGPVTVTVPVSPSGSALGLGLDIYKADSTANLVTVARSGTDTFVGTNNFNGGTSSTSVPLRRVGDNVNLTSVAGGYYALGGGGSTSLSLPGYEKRSSGLIHQWGNITAPGNVSISFPLAFPNACLFLCANALAGNNTQYNVNVANFSTNGFDMFPSSGGSPSALAVGWHAIGY